MEIIVIPVVVLLIAIVLRRLRRSFGGKRSAKDGKSLKERDAKYSGADSGGFWDGDGGDSGGFDGGA